MNHNGQRTIAFVAYGSYGDIYPLLAIAQVMQRDGHDVVFIANAYFADTIRRAAIAYEEAGTCAEQIAARETTNNSGETFAGAMMRYDNLIGCNYARVALIIEKLRCAGKRLLIVTHGRMSPAFPICEQHNIPVVMTYYAPTQIPDNREDYVLYRTSFGRSAWFARHVRYPLHQIKSRIYRTPFKRYSEWRQQAGYAPVPNPGWWLLRNILTGKGIVTRPRDQVVAELALLPQWFADPIGNDISHLQFTGFVFHEDQSPANNRLVDDFIATHGSPIVFTPGTAVEDAVAFCGAIVETCRLLNAPAIVLSRYVATTLTEFDFSAAGVSVLALDHVDLGYLLPKSRLLVHHGGIGTLAQAIRAGIPQIVRPRMYDQPNNGLRVVLNGVGGMLYGDGYTATEIAAVYQHLTDSELHRQHLAYYRDLTSEHNGAVTAAKAIADCVQQHLSPSAAHTTPTQIRFAAAVE